MKKIVAIILCVAVIFVLVKCVPAGAPDVVKDVESIAAPVVDNDVSSEVETEQSSSEISSVAQSSQKQTVTSSKKSDTSVSGPTYIKGVLIVNKTYSVPASYAPGVDPTAKAWLNKMFTAAGKAGLDLYIASGYRSYQRQSVLYNNYVSIDGKAAADRYSARPGHSEHQTGLAFDINDPSDSFIGTPESKWLAAHCYEYGFIIRYQQNKESITGFKYEPWHVRYVGVELAQTLQKSGQCLEEYLGVTSKYAD